MKSLMSSWPFMWITISTYLKNDCLMKYQFNNSTKHKTRKVQNFVDIIFVEFNVGIIVVFK